MRFYREKIFESNGNVHEGFGRRRREREGEGGRGTEKRSPWSPISGNRCMRALGGVRRRERERDRGRGDRGRGG
jgi:hypothetical protein